MRIFCSFILVFVLFNNSGYAQPVEKLFDNTFSVEIEDFSFYSFIKEDDFLNKDYYVFGHQDDLANSHKIELKFLLYLNKEDNVKYWLMDIDPAQALMMNKYLEDGDENHIREVLFGWRIQKSPLNCQDLVSKLDSLKYHNDTLSDKSKKIEIVGINKIQNYNVVYKSLSQIVEYGQSNETDTLIDLMDWGYKYQDREKVNRLTNAIHSDLLKDSITFRGISESQIDYYNRIIYLMAHENDDSQYLKFENIKHFISTHLSEKYMLSVSYFDGISLPVYYKSKSVTFYLNEYYPEHKKSSLLLVPYKCKAHRLIKPSFELTDVDFSYADAKFFKLNVIDSLKSVINKEINIFDIYNKDLDDYNFLIEGTTQNTEYIAEPYEQKDLQYHFLIVLNKALPVSLLK